MTTISRRNAVLSATAAGVAFGLDKHVEIIGSAAAQTATSPLNPKGAGFYKFKVGDIEITQVWDGSLQRPHDAGFFKNASIDETKAALKAAGLPDESLPNVYTVTLAKIGGKTVMFDSGSGESGAPGTGELFKNMKAAGIEKSDISAIVITHFHGDHVWGLLTKENAAVYGDIPIYMPSVEYKFWTDPAVIDKLAEMRKGIARRVQATFPNWKNIIQYDDGKDVMPGVRAVATYGHTPGHTSLLLSSGSAQMMVLADITNVPAFNMRNPGWHVMFDQDGPMAEATRRSVFDRAVADKMLCSGYHWGMPGAGTIQKDGNGYALVPIG